MTVTRPFLIAFLVIASLVAIWGGFLTWMGLHHMRDGLTSAGASLMVAALVALTAAGGVNTWIAERSRVREEKARGVYETLSVSLMARYDSSGLSQLRAQVATWASPAVVDALSAWNLAYDTHALHLVPDDDGNLTLDADGVEAMRSATTGVVKAIRSELGYTSNASTLEHALFNTSPDSPAPTA